MTLNGNWELDLGSPALAQNEGAITSGQALNAPFTAGLTGTGNSAMVLVSGTVQDGGGNTHNWSNDFIIDNVMQPPGS
jgi:hypothetical protein